ncbi:hypothetical protein CL633_04080 [bacterium]|nr:hypothetical protein [bacterium]|tara:strand:+ start:5256 stop:5894 length:639 start_codon:yes stop_codon:yes gene_type:complete
MKKIEAIQVLQKSNKKIFTLPDLRKLLNIENDNTAYKQAEGLIKSNILKRAIKGVYYLVMDSPSDFELANFIYQPSYISLESALNYYGILIQSSQQITSITSKSAKNIEVDNKEFTYAHLDQKYFSNYKQSLSKDKQSLKSSLRSDYKKVDSFIIATPEKALIDTMFFTSIGRSHLNLDELILDSINKTKFQEIASKISNRAFKNYLKLVKL